MTCTRGTVPKYDRVRNIPSKSNNLRLTNKNDVLPFGRHLRYVLIRVPVMYYQTENEGRRKEQRTLERVVTVAGLIKQPLGRFTELCTKGNNEIRQFDLYRTRVILQKNFTVRFPRVSLAVLEHVEHTAHTRPYYFTQVPRTDSIHSLRRRSDQSVFGLPNGQIYLRNT